MSAGKIVLLVIGALIGLLAAVLLVGGTALTAGYLTQRDDDDFLNSPRYDLESDGYALVSEDIDIAPHTGDWWPADLASVRFEIESQGSGPVFVGIGPSGDVDSYLSGVALDRIERLGDRDDVDYESQGGTAPATPPGAQDFWVVSSEGPGMQTVTWEIEDGTWRVVVMNSDASAGVNVEARAGAKAGILLSIGIGLLVAGVVAAIVAALFLVLATRQQRPADRLAQGPAIPGTAGIAQAMLATAPVRPVYPVTLEGTLDPGLSRWMWLVKWILAIPHYIVLFFLWIAFAILTIVAFFAILITGRYPRGMFDFNVGVLRWTWRVGFYSLTAIGTDKYPPFTFDDVDYPARLRVEYPERLSRGLVLVKWWLLAIPQYLLIGVFTSNTVWWSWEDTGAGWGGGLISLLVLFAAIALLFTAKYPRGIFNLVIGLNRWVYRVTAYATLMRDEYPPFRLDMGEKEPVETERWV